MFRLAGRATKLSAEQFASDLERDTKKLEKLYFQFRGEVTSIFLDVANTLASVKTGALKAGILPWEGSPPTSFKRPEDAPRHDPRRGTPAWGNTKQAAIRLSKKAGTKGRFGIASTASYSSYIEDGTDKITARPFFEPARFAASKLKFHPSRLS